ncbi:diaminopimelate decarboxylase [Mucilaginibacter paludis]|uniref:Diaminopimelate decarboxylase n=1 Tax=Mucilaginibacter paludis DSM 18603 TaxID=714943 RepID=H1Y3B7_9SPHI|nr:diaminopimelate decarboxylase [Mucilaginibacter paludis]EHQ29272.1 diaminopimelate decarboxylase [Mucilaginibacter paludis DSM 18603]
MFNSNTLARFQNIETPFYYYDLKLLKETLQACADASAKYNFHVHYAMKANFNPRVLDLIQSYGFGADCVSGGEVKAAIAHGFDKGKVVFAGVGKSDKEINEALDREIFCFNIESVQELQIINDLAKAKNKTASVAIRINPNVDAHTHHFITTGLEENKFGVNIWELPAVAEALAKCPHLKFLGIHFHIGSQITDLGVYKNLCIRVNELQLWFEERGLPIKVLNLGGGLGVDYQQPDANPICDFESYFKVFNDFLNVKPNQEVHFELGRALVAQSAALVSRVLYVKNGIKKNFLILDAGMTELIRPMLYQAYHQIENLSRGEEAGSERQGAGSRKLEPGIGSQEAGNTDSELQTPDSRLNSPGSELKYDVVGPICESTDCFRKDVDLPESFRGDLIVVRTAGAYGEVMASGYNLRERVQSVYSE